MRKSVVTYIASVMALAGLLSVVVYHAAPSVAPGTLVTIGLLCALALLAEVLGFVVADSAIGSVAYVPYFAMALLVPSWETLAAIALVKTLSEVFVRKVVKAAFNVAQFTIACALAILTFRSLGGESLLHLTSAGLYSATLRVGGATYAAMAVAFAANTALVAGILIIANGRSARDVWREVFRPSVAMNLLAPPVVFLFSWFFAFYGPFAAAALWVPILGMRQVSKSKTDLERTNRELLELLVKSIEARDPYTSGHSRRVQRYSTIIARAIGMREREVEQIGHAALLHDVGKIYEKYAPILAKADKLTPREWATMQEHPVDGANLVAMMSNLREIVPAIRHHHEKWDGSGYPDGLSGENIPLASRIITFADTIDAMTSERPYRRPLQPEQVRSEILRCREQQFDPAIADRLLASPAWVSLFSPQQRDSVSIKGLHIVRTGEFKLGAS